MVEQRTGSSRQHRKADSVGILAEVQREEAVRMCVFANGLSV